MTGIIQEFKTWSLDDMRAGVREASRYLDVLNQAVHRATAAGLHDIADQKRECYSDHKRELDMLMAIYAAAKRKAE